MTSLTIKKTRNRYGLFTEESITAGTVVDQIKGKIFDYRVLLNVGGNFLNNCIRFGELTYLSPQGYDFEFINHSCNPNCRIEKRRGKLYLIALKNIPKDSELFFDYSTITASDDIWTMKCNCGEKACRKIIKNYTKLPKPILQHYLDNKIVPDYILKL
jgi:uncharacterized protein